MTTKTITVMEDAYELLAKEKRKDKSFSDVIRRITSKNKDLTKYFNILSSHEVNIINDTISEGRKKGRVRSKKGDDLFTV
ncbi:MAG: antitoxin VapB family protein [Candidatus Woesearchaeota archaeon]